MVTTDWYSRAVLTVIALCLVWLCVDSVATETVAAQANHQRVVIAGWQDENGFIHPFPEYRVGTNAGMPAGLPVREAR